MSGAHYNPAVSLAVFVRGKMAGNELGAYVIVQIVAAVVAGLVVVLLGYDADKAQAVAGAGKMLVVEFLFTFALAFVVLNVATAEDTQNNSFYGLAIGFTVAAGAFAVGSVSGGAFNPAVAVGASVLGLFAWSNIWIYLIAGFAGGAAAAAAFRLTQPVAEPGQPARERPAEADVGLQAA